MSLGCILGYHGGSFNATARNSECSSRRSGCCRYDLDDRHASADWHCARSPCSDLRTTTKHYNRARGIEASRAHAQIIAGMRRSGRAEATCKKCMISQRAPRKIQGVFKD